MAHPPTAWSGFDAIVGETMTMTEGDGWASVAIATGVALVNVRGRVTWPADPTLLASSEIAAGTHLTPSCGPRSWWTRAA